MHKYKIWLSPPHLNGTEIGFITEAIAKNWISPYGENSDVFEQQLKSYYNSHIALVNSGTSAIHLALILAGVGMGDEVIVPTLNFVGCVNPVLYQHAVPLFIDSESDTYNVDPAIVEELIVSRLKSGKKPKAILAVDIFGIPCKIKELLIIAEKYDIQLIEDAADALGSTVEGIPIGSFGKMGIVSFNGNKMITTSGGGALISADEKLIEKAKYLRNQARELIPHYIHKEVGYNYMLSNVLAGIGRGQFTTLEQRVSRRREIFSTYKNELQSIECLEFKDDLPGTFSNRWLTSVVIHPNPKNITRHSIYQHLAENEIESRPIWYPMHLQPAFNMHPYFGGNVAEIFFKNGLCLPSGSLMTDNELLTVIDRIKELFEKK